MITSLIFSCICFVVLVDSSRPAGLPPLRRFESEAHLQQSAKDIAKTLAESQSYKCTRSAAKWLQMMFHDSGTRFMDGSLKYELDREGNVNQDMEPEIDLFSSFDNNTFEFSDTLCIATSVAIKLCAGIDVPFSYGRIDAFEADDGFLPAPNNSAQDTIARFDSFGLTVDEAVAVIFGAHSVGRVRTRGVSVDGNIGPMDKTNDKLDNKIFKSFDKPPKKKIKDGKLVRLQARLNLLDDIDAIVAIRAYARDQDLFYDRMSSGMVKLCDNVDSTTVALSHHFLVTENIRPKK